MKHSIQRKFETFLFVALLMSGTLRGQSAASPQPKGQPSTTASPAQPTQSSTASPSRQSDDTYIIGDDDVLSIDVWKEPDLSKQIPVLSDGRISLPLIGEVQAAGRTPSQLEQDIAGRLKSYVNDPQVTVIVQQINSLKFNILGQVIKPGSYPLLAGTTIVDAIATAGGFKDFAKKKSIYILRQTPGGEQSRIPFNYQDFIKGKNAQQNIIVKPRDTIVVP